MGPIPCDELCLYINTLSGLGIITNKEYDLVPLASWPPTFQVYHVYQHEVDIHNGNNRINISDISADMMPTSVVFEYNHYKWNTNSEYKWAEFTVNSVRIRCVLLMIIIDDIGDSLINTQIEARVSPISADTVYLIGFRYRRRSISRNFASFRLDERVYSDDMYEQMDDDMKLVIENERQNEMFGDNYN